MLGEEGLRVVAVPQAQALRHTLCMGKSGSGKTYWLLGVLAQLLAQPGVSCAVVDLKGETVLSLLWLLQLLERAPRLRPEDVCVIAPWSGYGVPLNPLAPNPGLDPATQAAVVVSLLDDLSDGGLGPRMTNIARWLVRAVMELGGSFLDVHALLVDETLAPRVARQVRDPELQTYLAHTFPKEPLSSRESIRARIENLLALPAARAMLCAKGSIDGSVLLESPLTLVHLGAGKMGAQRVARFIGSWIFTLITTAIFSRDQGARLPAAYVVIDEWAQLAKVAAEDIEDILSRSRSVGVSLTLANQYPAQIRSVSQALWEGVQANVALEVLFRPDAESLRHVDAALPVTGRMVDPQRPDRLLSEADEKRLLMRQLGNLKPRQAIFVNHLAGTPAELISTFTVPIARARAAWDALTDAERDTWWRGRYGVPLVELVPARMRFDAAEQVGTHAAEPPSATTGAHSDDEPVSPRPRSSGARRPRLKVLP
ncbi:MAG: hypothetical protein Q8P41_18585 [Pseudomonadota bacterium]|nr:hypothetical protein [Pseudomonadota bacterium]